MKELTGADLMPNLKYSVASRSMPPPWGSIRFRPAPRTYDAPPCGLSVRVVSQTKPRKIPTRKMLPLFVATTHPKNTTALFRDVITRPTSVKSADCPACGAGHTTDGRADDGNVDASSAACRACIWSKRLKPQLYDQGVTTFWLDDDERNKFTFNQATCAPTTPTGGACSSSACCASGFCDPSLEKCAKKMPSPPLSATPSLASSWAAGAGAGEERGLARREESGLAQAGVNCSGEAGVDVGGGGGQPRIAYLHGTTQETCCANCSATKACKTWVFAPKNDTGFRGEGLRVQGRARVEGGGGSSHSAGDCWLLTGAAAGSPHKNRVSGGDLTPRGPCPGPACPPDASGGHYDCGPGAYCAMAMAGNLWPRTYSDGIAEQGAAPLILSRNAWAGAVRLPPGSVDTHTASTTRFY